MTQVGSGVGKPFMPRQFFQGCHPDDEREAGLLDPGGRVFHRAAGAARRDHRQHQFGEREYTRRENFRLDANGYMITQSGERVQGWTLDTETDAINTANAIGDILVPLGSSVPATATSYFKV